MFGACTKNTMTLFSPLLDNRMSSPAVRSTTVPPALRILIVVLLLLLFPSSVEARVAAAPLSYGPPLPLTGGNCTPSSVSVPGEGVSTGSCQPTFFVDSGSLNTSFALLLMAEVTPQQQVVAVSNLLVPAPENTSTITTSEGVNLTIQQSITVNNGSGLWLPGDVGGLGSSPILPGSGIFGTAQLQVTFHLSKTLTPNATIAADLRVANWPWVNSAQDSLGLALEALGTAGSHYSYQNANRSLLDQWDGNNTTIASLEFGSTASDGSATPLSVNVQGSLQSSGGNYRQSVTLFTFVGAGGYSELTYGSRILFPAPWAAAPAGPPGDHSSTNFASDPRVWGALIGVAGGCSVLGYLAFRARRKPIDVDL